MKINAARGIHYDSGPNMTPLVDVVMVILIFLMLAGSFAGSESFLESNLPYTPKGAGGVPPPKGFVPDQPLEIKVDSPVPDRFVARVEGSSADDAQSLLSLLNRQRVRMAAIGTKTDKVQVIISPGRNVKYRFLIDVYQAAMQARFEKIGFTKAR
jgi:biopolymer transport protein ExbD